MYPYIIPVYTTVIFPYLFQYTEVHTCVHSYSEECHDTFVTTYEPHQEEECDEKFRKTCTIWNEDVALNEEVEVCNTRYHHLELLA